MSLLKIIFTTICGACVVGVCVMAYEWITGKVKWDNDNNMDGG